MGGNEAPGARPGVRKTGCPILSSRLAVTLGVSADVLLFDNDERGPDEMLRLQFEAVSPFPKEEKKIIQALLDEMIIKHHTRQIVDELRS